MLIDPSKQEEESEEMSPMSEKVVGQITIGYQPSLEQIALLAQEGHVSTAHLIQDTQVLTKISAELKPNIHTCLVESIKNSESS